MMIRNYIKIAFRNLIKNKTFSLINILGLAFGLCCALLIALWVGDEYAVDNFHSKKDRIYWVISELKPSSGSQFWTSSPGPLAEVIKEEVPGIAEAVRLSQNRELLFMKNESTLEESGIFADPAILNVYDFPLLQGNPQSTLNDPNSIVISNALADKLFPNSDALNNTITIDYWGMREVYKITGILDDIPRSSTLQFDFIIPFETHLKREPWNKKWGNYNNSTVLLLDDHADVEKISEHVSTLISKHNSGEDTELHLYPFKDIYLQADFSKGLHAQGRIKYVRIFSVIAIIILLIACINFMNLSTARAGSRAKEVGVRKATGANRGSLIKQFLGESILVATIGGLLAITIADLLLAPFNDLTGKFIMMPYDSWLFIISVISLCLLTGVLAGIYPAIYLSGFKPGAVLKTAITGGRSLTGFRRVLVIFQFSLSIIFIITTIVVYSQFQFIINKDLGASKENILRHHLNSIMGNREAYRNEILKLPGVKTMSTADHSPLSVQSSTIGVDWKGKAEGDEIHFHIIQSDAHFTETFDLHLLNGKGFSGKYDSGAMEVIINEEAAKAMMLEEPIGAHIKLRGNNVEVVGLVKNFHHQSLSKNIEPVIIFFNPPAAFNNFIAIDGNINQTVKAIEDVYSKFEKNYPFDYGFVDEDFEMAYTQVLRMGKLSGIFALIAIFVSSLGLFGLASYMTEQRKKETGIRKVLGATVFRLVRMFSTNFLVLVLISFIISAPIAWYLSSNWLEEFVFKIDIGFRPFVIGGLLAAVVALATVSYHTIRAATANPTDSLKCE